MADFNEYDLVARLQRKNDIRIEGTVIKELTREKSKGDVGIKSKGYIDFLTKHRGYTHYYVTGF